VSAGVWAKVPVFFYQKTDMTIETVVGKEATMHFDAPCGWLRPQGQSVGRQLRAGDSHGATGLPWVVRRVGRLGRLYLVCARHPH
jgi:hypothetical protein